MSWDRSSDNFQFACDTGECLASLIIVASDFATASHSAKETGWVTHKRVGRNWTYHCPACAEQAERDHQEHLKREQERERIKARNS